MMLEFLGRKDAHDGILAAIVKALHLQSSASRTPDLGGQAATVDAGNAIAAALADAQKASLSKMKITPHAQCQAQNA